MKELKEIENILDMMVEDGFLKRVGNKYIDSDLTTQMLNDGLTRQEIGFVLMREKKIKQRRIKNE